MEGYYNKILITWYPRYVPHFAVKHPNRNLVTYDIGPTYVVDPLGILHDNSGAIILLEREKIVSKIEPLIVSMVKSRKRDKWTRVGTECFRGGYIYRKDASGTFYKTNKRFIFISSPMAAEHIKDAGPAVIGRLKDATHASRLKKLGRKDCLSIPLNSIDIVKLKKGWWGKRVVMYIAEKEAKYTLFVISHSQPTIEEFLKLCSHK